jgi:hypothetical protein
MPTIYETMDTRDIVAGEMQFTVNSAVPSVVVLGPGFLSGEFRNAGNLKYFELGDNITILGVSVMIPYGFAQGQGVISDACLLGIAWRDALDNSILIPELGVLSAMSLPSICDGLQIPGGLFIKAPVAVPGRLRLVLDGLTLSVSQLNVPALINATVINVRVGIQLLHTKPMAGVP